MTKLIVWALIWSVIGITLLMVLAYVYLGSDETDACDD